MTKTGFPDFLINRLICDPIQSSVPGSLPVLFFGDIFTAKIATVGINPSRQEYLSPNGIELTGNKRRFETLNSLGALNRRELNHNQVTVAIERMCQYFDPDQPAYSWFNGLKRVVNGMGASFPQRSAVHLDLVQEATDPVWSQLLKNDKREAQSVLIRDLQFLRTQIEEFNFNVIVCTSALVYKQVRNIFDINVLEKGKLKRLEWEVGSFNTSRGLIGVAGWNIPLAQPTGLNKEEQILLGSLLSSKLTSYGIKVV